MGKHKDDDEKRRRRILREIREKERQVDALNDFKTDLQQRKSEITKFIEKWTLQRTSFFRTEIAQTVVVKNVFEGTAASAVQLENKSMIDIMDNKISDAKSVNEGIDNQITKIDNKIALLNSEISNLRSKL